MFELSYYSMICYNIILTACYVGVLYLIPQNIRKLPRNEPVHIKYRMMVVSVTSCLLMLITYWLYLRPYNLNGTLKYINIFSKTDVVPRRLASADYDADGIFLCMIGWRIDNMFESVFVSICLMMMFYMGMFWCVMEYFDLHGL